MQFTATLIAAFSLALVASAAPLDIEKRGAVHHGSATFYYQGGNAGSCGQYHSDNDYIVAMPQWLHKSSGCGKYISITRGSKTIKAKIADTCPGCEGYHIDLSSGAFKALASKSEGQVAVSWHRI